MNLILLERDEAPASGLVTLSDGRAGHLVKVLQVTPGQQVRVGIIDGPCGLGTVSAVDGTTVQLRCAFDSVIPQPPPVDLLLALPRPKVMRRLWAQLAAIGVGRIMLTNAARVERDYFGTHIVEPAFYRPLLVEGLQQARDTRLPVVSIHRRFKVFVEDELDSLVADSGRLVADPAAAASVATIVRQQARERILLAVGPEGGWTAFELERFEAHGFLRAGMGRRTLRSDTACVALLTLVHDALGR